MKKNFRSYDLAVEFHNECCQLSLPGYLKDQLYRAAASIALNLAEGSGRGSKKDQKRFFDIAFASLRESQAVLDLIQCKNTEIIQLADRLAANIYCLIQSMKRELK